MKIEFTKGHKANKKGSVVDIDPVYANDLIDRGVAKATKKTQSTATRTSGGGDSEAEMLKDKKLKPPVNG